MAADVNALLDFLRQGFNQSGAITKFNDGTMSAPETNNINQYGPIPQQVVTPVTAAYDPASAPIDLNDFTGAGSVDQGTIQSQDNMAPMQAPTVTEEPKKVKVAGDNKAQAAAREKRAIGTEAVTKGVVSSPRPEMINLGLYGDSVSAPTTSSAADTPIASARGYAEDAPMKAQPQATQQSMAYTEDAPQVQYAHNGLMDGDKITGAGATLGGALLSALIFAASRGRAKPQAVA